MQWQKKHMRRHRKRAAAVAQVAVCSTVILGMGALVIDIGAMYTAQTELQVAADAAALAAASQLAGLDGSDPRTKALEAAGTYAQLNQPVGLAVQVFPDDLEFGRSEYNPNTERFRFQEGGGPFDSVRVTLRHAPDSSRLKLPFLFAPILGAKSTQLEARAAAVFIPRDIAVVIDLSNSMNYDSQLRYWNRTDGGYSNLRDIWCALDGPEPQRPYLPSAVVDETEYADDTGPTFGYMTEWGAPLQPTNPGRYNHTSDPGLTYIRRNYSQSASVFGPKLSAAGYNASEQSALLSSSNDGTATHFVNRTGVLLGLAQWRSGKSGAAYPGGGNGDNVLANSEMVWLPNPPFAKSWNWSTFINYQQGSTAMFRYYYGLKTFTNFLLDNQPRPTQTEGLWATPQQPLRATKDAVLVLADVIDSLESLDQLSLEVYGRYAAHEIDLTDDLYRVPNRLYQRQTAHYDTTTNIGGGMYHAIASLLYSETARRASSKIMVLMSDGLPNEQDTRGSLSLIDQMDPPAGSPQSWGSGGSAPSDYALAMARIAANNKIRIFTVSVGSGSDRSLMQSIAAIGGGQEFYADGTPEEYTKQLEDIFRSLGGKRPVALIE
ncbi:MAG: VWA domain-containing protein [Phycisphaerales bacterium]|nr:VWA domain-containing protein [Phycisphaerales bacterium]